jgi:hypothetical protein
MSRPVPLAEIFNSLSVKTTFSAECTRADKFGNRADSPGGKGM